VKRERGEEERWANSVLASLKNEMRRLWLCKYAGMCPCLLLGEIADTRNSSSIFSSQTRNHGMKRKKTWANFSIIEVVENRNI
jgi:hypothetical protein